MRGLGDTAKKNIEHLKFNIENFEAILKGDKSIDELKGWGHIPKRHITMIDCDKKKCVNRIMGRCTNPEVSLIYEGDKMMCGSMTTRGKGYVAEHVESFKKDLAREEESMRRNG